MTVYLLHFERPLGNPATPHGQARHYIGSCWDLETRCKEHAHGAGAAIMRAAGAAGIPWQVVRTWEGGRKLERKLKARHDAPGLCPVCGGRAALARGAYSDLEVWTHARGD